MVLRRCALIAAITCLILRFRSPRHTTQRYSVLHRHQDTIVIVPDAIIDAIPLARSPVLRSNIALSQPIKVMVCSLVIRVNMAINPHARAMVLSLVRRFSIVRNQIARRGVERGRMRGLDLRLCLIEGVRLVLGI